MIDPNAKSLKLCETCGRTPIRNSDCATCLRTLLDEVITQRDDHLVLLRQSWEHGGWEITCDNPRLAERIATALAGGR